MRGMLRYPCSSAAAAMECLPARRTGAYIMASREVIILHLLLLAASNILGAPKWCISQKVSAAITLLRGRP